MCLVLQMFVFIFSFLLHTIIQLPRSTMHPSLTCFLGCLCEHWTAKYLQCAHTFLSVLKFHLLFGVFRKFFCLFHFFYFGSIYCRYSHIHFWSIWVPGWLFVPLFMTTFVMSKGFSLWSRGKPSVCLYISQTEFPVENHPCSSQGCQ